MKLFDKYFQPYAEYCIRTTFSEDELKAVLKKECPATGISSSTLANMVAGKNVSMEVLLKICDTMQCDFADSVEAVPEKEVCNGK